jgi:uncharacterized protein YjbJ (UPF0337 family)
VVPDFPVVVHGQKFGEALMLNLARASGCEPIYFREMELNPAVSPPRHYRIHTILSGPTKSSLNCGEWKRKPISINRLPANTASAVEERVMNKEQIAGKTDQLMGKVEQSIGEAVGNQKLANKGIAEQAKGAAKETLGNAKDAAHQITESHKEAASQTADQARSSISESIDNAKDKVKQKIDDFKERHSA